MILQDEAALPAIPAFFIVCESNLANREPELMGTPLAGTVGCGSSTPAMT